LRSFLWGVTQRGKGNQGRIKPSSKGEGGGVKKIIAEKKNRKERSVGKKKFTTAPWKGIRRNLKKRGSTPSVLFQKSNKKALKMKGAQKKS